MIASANHPIAPTLTPQQAAERAWDAVVIGAGPAGAAAAVLLARQNVKVLLVEKAAHPRYKVCGGCLGAAALEMLAQLGLDDLVAGLPGCPTAQLKLHSESSTVTIPLPRGLSISRELFDAALISQAIAAGAHYLDRTSARVAGVSQDRCHVRLRTADLHETLAAKIVLAADGLSGSSITGVSSLATSVRVTSRIGVGAIVEPGELGEIEPVQRGTIGMHYAPGGYVGLVRVENDRLNVAAAFDPSYLRKAGGPAKAVARHLAATTEGCPAALRDAEYLGTPALTRQRQFLASERVLVIGDAAGYVEPFTGEGMTWAILSAALAVPLALEAIGHWHTGLARAWQQRHAVAVGRQQRACRLVSAISRHALVCNSVIRLLSFQPMLARAAAGYVSGVERVVELARVPWRTAVAR